MNEEVLRQTHGHTKHDSIRNGCIIDKFKVAPFVENIIEF